MFIKATPGIRWRAMMLAECSASSEKAYGGNGFIAQKGVLFAADAGVERKLTMKKKPGAKDAPGQDLPEALNTLPGCPGNTDSDLRQRPYSSICSVR